jgi:tetratricopeptide (TPR) repeat protein
MSRTFWPHHLNFLFLFSSLCSLCLCGESSAQLNPEKDTPYHLQIVLQVADHPPLTPAFKDQVKRELRASLQDAFADLARVEIVDTHPLLKEIDSKGLPAALEGWKDISSQKTHFIMVDFRDGQYSIQAGQHDGFTGLASPMTRAAQVSDREFVARTAALLVERDFGLVGTLEGNPRGSEVKMILKAAGLGIPMDRWIKENDVFAIAQVKRTAGSLRSTRVPWALLKVVDISKDGACRCQLFNRFKDPLEKSPAVLGYRCLKLGTTTAPLHMRLVNSKDMMPIAGQAVAVSAGDFSAKPREERSTQADGSLETHDAFQNIAFVRVMDVGGEVRAQVPVEILGDRVVILTLDRQSDSEGQFALARKRLVSRLYESIQVVGQLFQDLNKKRADQEALETAQRGLKAMDSDIASFKDELASLQKTARELPKGSRSAAVDFTEGERRLQELQAKREELNRFAENLNKALQEVNSPENQRRAAQIAQAKLAENNGEFDQAIQIYEDILKNSPDQSAVSDHLKKLKASWAVKDKQHQGARDFIYGDWPKYTTAQQMKQNLADARKAFQICRNADDKLTPLKLLKSNIDHTVQLNKESEGLEPEKNEDDRAKFQTIADVADGLKKLTEEINAFLNDSK